MFNRLFGGKKKEKREEKERELERHRQNNQVNQDSFLNRRSSARRSIHIDPSSLPPEYRSNTVQKRPKGPVSLPGGFVEEDEREPASLNRSFDARRRERDRQDKHREIRYDVRTHRRTEEPSSDYSSHDPSPIDREAIASGRQGGREHYRQRTLYARELDEVSEEEAERDDVFNERMHQKLRQLEERNLRNEEKFHKAKMELRNYKSITRELTEQKDYLLAELKEENKKRKTAQDLIRTQKSEIKNLQLQLASFSSFVNSSTLTNNSFAMHQQQPSNHVSFPPFAGLTAPSMRYEAPLGGGSSFGCGPINFPSSSNFPPFPTNPAPLTAPALHGTPTTSFADDSLGRDGASEQLADMDETGATPSSRQNTSFHVPLGDILGSPKRTPRAMQQKPPPSTEASPEVQMTPSKNVIPEEKENMKEELLESLLTTQTGCE